jgi:hypothetical protein
MVKVHLSMAAHDWRIEQFIIYAHVLPLTKEKLSDFAAGPERAVALRQKKGGSWRIRLFTAG